MEVEYWSFPMIKIGTLPTVSLQASPNAGYNTLFCGLLSFDKIGNLSKDDTVIVNGTIIKSDGGWIYAYPCEVVDQRINHYSHYNVKFDYLL